jgi:GntR family transcriptional regulator/MocR family aminotransferase
MPSSRDLSIELRISRNIVTKVFEQLLLEGFLSSKTGSGTFVNASVTPLVSKPRKNSTAPAKRRAHRSVIPRHTAFSHHSTNLEPIVPFQQSVPLFSEFSLSTWQRVSAHVNNNIQLLHLGYDDAQGYLPLRQAMCDHLRISRSVDCEPERMVIVNGARQALHLTVELLLKPNDMCWMENPGYPGATSAMNRFGTKICPVPVTDNGLDINFAIHNYPNANLVYVTPSHQFPMGSTMPLGERLKLLDYARKKNMWIVEDDYDSEFRYNGRPIPAFQSMDTNGNVIYIGNLSKVLFPALRLGYMVFPDADLARKFATAKSVIDGQTTILNQAAAFEFIHRGFLSRHIRKMKIQYKKNQDDLVRLLNLHLSDHLQPLPVDAGMHLVALIRDNSNSQEIVAKAAKKGLIIHSLSEYSLNKKIPNGLVLGFAGFKEKDLEMGVLLLKKVFG